MMLASWYDVGLAVQGLCGCVLWVVLQPYLSVSPSLPLSLCGCTCAEKNPLCATSVLRSTAHFGPEEMDNNML